MQATARAVAPPLPSEPTRFSGPMGALLLHPAAQNMVSAGLWKSGNMENSGMSKDGITTIRKHENLNKLIALFNKQISMGPDSEYVNLTSH